MTSPEPDTFFSDYFARMIDALEVLRLPAEEQCDVMGAYNVGWELQHDVVDMIESVVTSSSNVLSGAGVDALLQIQGRVNQLPPEAINAPGMSMTTHEGCLLALSHPSWQELREQAARVLDGLQVEILLNRARLASE